MTARTVKPAFTKTGEDLFLQLRHEVNRTVKALEPTRKRRIKIKAYLFPTLYVAAYFVAITWGRNLAIFYSAYFAMGIFLVLNYLNIVHEAVHGTLFRNNAINRAYVGFFDLMGANSYIFKIRHVRFHHNYPNIQGWDTDFEQSPLARVFPHGPFSKLHKYQHIYLPFLYPLYLFNWLLVRDFKDFFKKKTIVHKLVTGIPRREYVKLFIFKAFFFFYMLVLPMLALALSFTQVLAGFLIFMFTASIFSLLVLLSPHASIESEFPMPDEKGMMHSTWFIHQLSCTNDVKEDNWFTRFFMGCFNYHIAHHLFPSVNHVYYPEITKTIRQFAEKNQLPYRTYSLATSLKNHYILLKNNAFHENIFEETM